MKLNQHEKAILKRICCYRWPSSIGTIVNMGGQKRAILRLGYREYEEVILSDVESLKKRGLINVWEYPWDTIKQRFSITDKGRRVVKKMYPELWMNRNHPLKRLYRENAARG